MANTRNMEKIQKRALRFLTDDTESNYSQLLEKTNISSLSLQRMRCVSIEVFKCLNQINPSFMSNMFEVKKSMYNLRKSRMLCLPTFNTVKYGKRSFSYNGCHLWNLLPDHIRLTTNLHQFKKLIKQWAGPTCVCKMCHMYIPNNV